MESTTPLFNAAIAKHQQGALAEAEQLYRCVLVVDPSDASTMNNLGLLRPVFEAVTLFQRALWLRPDFAQAARNLGDNTPAPWRSYDYVLSLGLNCEVAANIRRITGQEVPFFFDWTQTPYQPLCALIERDLADVFLLENLVILETENTVLDQGSGLWFHHVFTRNQHNRVTPETLQREWKQHDRVVRYLRNRWLEVTGSAERLLFVILTDPAEDADLPSRMTALLRLLQRKSPQAMVDLLAVSRPGAPRPPDQDHLFFRQAAAGIDFDGIHADWDRVLAGFSLRPKPPE